MKHLHLCIHSIRCKKRWLLASLILLGSLHLHAQNDSLPEVIRVSRQTVSFGFGIVPENTQFINDFFSQGTFGDLFYISHYTFGDLVTTGALNINYSYNLSKLFTFGCFIGYQEDSKNIFENSTGSKMGSARQTFASVTPRMTLFWRNRKVFRMYSGVGCSFSQYWTKYTFGDTKFSNKMNHWKPQLTLIGIQAGRRFYGFGEINIGGRLGYLNMGIGYRFGSSKRYF